MQLKCFYMQKGDNRSSFHLFISLYVNPFVWWRNPFQIIINLQTNDKLWLINEGILQRHDEFQIFAKIHCAASDCI